MPTYSNSKNFDLAVNDIIQEAYERCGLMVRDGYDLKTAKRSLNLMFAEWANRGLNLWTIQQTTKTLTANAQSVTGTSLFGSGADAAQQIIDVTDVTQVKVRFRAYSNSTVSWDGSSTQSRTAATFIRLGDT